MDHFGIGAAMQGIAKIYFRSARHTGRTTSLVESVKDGDRIVFADGKEAERVRGMCLARGVAVECVVVASNNLGSLFERGNPTGRTLFDHSWVERFYLEGIEHSKRVIDDWHQMASGCDPRPETMRCSDETAKWRG